MVLSRLGLWVDGFRGGLKEEEVGLMRVNGPYSQGRGVGEDGNDG